MTAAEDRALERAYEIVRQVAVIRLDYQKVCPPPWTDKVIDFIRALFLIQRSYRG